MLFIAVIVLSGMICVQVIPLDISHDAQKQIISELEVLHRVRGMFLCSIWPYFTARQIQERCAVRYENYANVAAAAAAGLFFWSSRCIPQKEKNMKKSSQKMTTTFCTI